MAERTRGERVREGQVKKILSVRVGVINGLTVVGDDWRCLARNFRQHAEFNATDGV